MMEILTAGQMREADRVAIIDMKIPALRLMENAGKAVAEEARRMRRAAGPGRVAVLCGKGNNGGDGLVAARHLGQSGYRILVFLTSEDFSKDAQAQFSRLPKKIHVVDIHTPALWKKEKRRLQSCDLLIDALFGTGLSKPLTGLFRIIVRDVNRLSKPVLAVDISSGIDASNGRVLGGGDLAIRCATSVTFARPKIGHVLHPGAAYAGRVVVRDIGIPDEAVRKAGPDTFAMDGKMAAAILPDRPDHSHKGVFGMSVIFAGARGMIGAAVLSTTAAMRIGSGLTRLFVPASVYSIAAKKLPPEAMCEPVPDGGGAFGPSALRHTSKFLARADSVLLGPGIGRHPKTIRWVLGTLRSITSHQKIVVDADALHAIAAKSFPRSGANADIAITPHAGEMAKLVGKSRAWVESDPCSAARDYSKKHGVTVVLKGSRTVIANAQGEVNINFTGNSALAKGGSGDVLAGMICGLAAQGMTTFDAARLGVFLHGRAADIAVESGRDKRTFLASDIFATLDRAILELKR